VFIPAPLVSLVQFRWITLGSAVIALPLVWLQAVNLKVNSRRYENWESLELE
jgi:hypothetical protein